MYNGAMSIHWDEIKLVLFDLDGTLNETDDQYTQRLADLLAFAQPLFPSWDRRSFARKLIMALETPGNMILGLPDRIGWDGLWDQFTKKLGIKPKYKHRVFKPVEGAIDMIESAAKHRMIGLASVRGSEVLEDFIAQTGLGDKIKFVIYGLSTERTKPSPDPILFACQQAGIDPKECVMVGDTTVDIIAGKRAGAKTVGVLCGFGTVEELIREEADMIVASTADLINCLG